MVNFGVPEGSILGLLLFLVQAYDLSRVLNPSFRTLRCCKLCCGEDNSNDDRDSDELVAFADDTTMASWDTGMSALQRKLTYGWMESTCN